MSRRVKSPGNFKISHVNQSCKQPCSTVNKQDFILIAKRIEMLESLLGMVVNNQNIHDDHSDVHSLNDDEHDNLQDQINLINQRIDSLEIDFQNQLQQFEVDLEPIIKQLAEHLSQLQTHANLHDDHSTTLESHSTLHLQHTNTLQDHSDLHDQHIGILTTTFGT